MPRASHAVGAIHDRVAAVTGMAQLDGVHPAAVAQPVVLDHVWPHLLAVLGSDPPAGGLEGAAPRPE